MSKNYGYDSKWFNLNNPNMTKPVIYRRLSGYCAPEMYCDTRGLRIFESEGTIVLKNEAIKDSNNSLGDVIAAIPKSNIPAFYTMLQDMLRDKGFLNEKNEFPSDEPKDSGFTNVWEEKGLTL